MVHNRPSAVRVSWDFRLSLTPFSRDHRASCMVHHRSPVTPSIPSSDDTSFTRSSRSAVWSIRSLQPPRIDNQTMERRGGRRITSHLHPHVSRRVRSMPSAIPSTWTPSGQIALRWESLSPDSREREREGGREKYLPRPGHPCEIVTRESKHGAVVACGSDHYRGKESERRVTRIHTLRALPVKYWSLDVSVVGLFPIDPRSSIS